MKEKLKRYRQLKAKLLKNKKWHNPFDEGMTEKDRQFKVEKDKRLSEIH